MRKLSLKEITSYTSGEFVLGNINNLIEEIEIDSRKATSKSIFVPIIGLTHDGHKFLEDAYLNGCRNFLCDINHEFYKEDINLIKVNDTTLALGDIAREYKKDYNLPYIAVTGSVGKTSTKDMIYGMLNEKFKAFKTEGNFNNNIGLPRTLLRLDNSYEIAVIEMGMDKKGEISYLCDIVNPEIGVITNIGMSHIEHFENQEGIFKAKMELVEKFNNNNLLIVNGDDKFLTNLDKEKTPYKLVKCGFNKNNDIYCNNYEITEKGISFTCIYNNEEHEFFIKSLAKHNILNAMFAIAIALEYNFTYEEIKKGLLNFELSKNRLDIFDTDKYKIINDCYNASYDSMKSALEVLNNFDNRKVAILGDIFELGSYSKDIHKNVGKLIKSNILITIGKDSKFIGEGAIENGYDKNNWHHFQTKEDFYKEKDKLLHKEDVILIKASRGMEFEHVVEYLKSN